MPYSSLLSHIALFVELIIIAKGNAMFGKVNLLDIIFIQFDFLGIEIAEEVEFPVLIILVLFVLIAKVIELLLLMHREGVQACNPAL